MSASVPSSNAVRASPFPAAPKARYLEFGRLADSRSPHPRVLPAFGPSAELVSPVGSEEARSIALALTSVRRTNWTCSFPASSFHEDAIL
jgi:hypothetical protein